MGSGPPAYQVTRAALNALTRTLAGELRGAGILSVRDGGTRGARWREQQRAEKHPKIA